jgi:hypothetical protein
LTSIGLPHQKNLIIFHDCHARAICYDVFPEMPMSNRARRLFTSVGNKAGSFANRLNR